MPVCNSPYRSRCIRQTGMSVLPFCATLQLSRADAFRSLTFWKLQHLWTNCSTVSRKPTNGSGVNWKSSDLWTNWLLTRASERTKVVWIGNLTTCGPTASSVSRANELKWCGLEIRRLVDQLLPQYCKRTNRSGPDWKSQDLWTNYLLTRANQRAEVARIGNPTTCGPTRRSRNPGDCPNPCVGENGTVPFARRSAAAKPFEFRTKAASSRKQCKRPAAANLSQTLAPRRLAPHRPHRFFPPMPSQTRPVASSYPLVAKGLQRQSRTNNSHGCCVLGGPNNGKNAEQCSSQHRALERYSSSLPRSPHPRTLS
jgi:hypothetical protein